MQLTEEEFWQLTPRQFNALMKHRNNTVAHEELMIAQLIAASINFSTQRPEKSVQPKDFMPSEWGKKDFRASQKKKRTRMTKKKRKEVADHFRAMWGTG